MGTRYSTGMPGIHEQFGPVLQSAVKSGMRPRQHSASFLPLLITFIVGIPVMPVWSALMFLAWLPRALFTNKDASIHKQAVSNVIFATVCFFIGLIIWNIASAAMVPYID